MSKKKRKENQANHCQCGGPEHCSCTKHNSCGCEHHGCEPPDPCSESDIVADLNNKILRLQAEIVNYRRRKEDETARLLKYQGEELILSLLPVVDDLERAIMMDDDVLDDEVSKFLKGFKMMYANLDAVLTKYEIKAINPLHEPFDPTYHQAVLTEKSEKYESGIITDVLGKGYMYKDKVIRPAMVKVNE